MLLRAVPVDAAHAALEDGEVVLDRVGVDLTVVQADVLAGRMLDRGMLHEMRREARVQAALVGHEAAVLEDVRLHDLRHVGLCRGRRMELAGGAATLTQRGDGTLVVAAIGIFPFHRNFSIDSATLLS